MGDNQGALALASNPEYHARTKHIDIQWHFVREQVEAGAVTLHYISMAEMVADGLIKPLAGVKFQQFIKALGMKKGGL